MNDGCKSFIRTWQEKRQSIYYRVILSIGIKQLGPTSNTQGKRHLPTIKTKEIIELV